MVIVSTGWRAYRAVVNKPSVHISFEIDPKLELMRRLVDRKETGDKLSVVVLGCSTGAEPYSVAWRIRSSRPGLRLSLNALDISPQAVEFGKLGVDSLTAGELASTAIFERMTKTEMDEISIEMAAL
jgi:chemotaxis methyl-accepting protein methylase